MVEKESKEIKIRGIIGEIGKMQGIKNKLLNEYREQKARFEEEKTREKDEMKIMEDKIKMKNE